MDLGLATQELRPEIDAAIARVLDSGRYIQGPEVDAFEQEFAALCSARYCVGVASGLDAITLTLLAMGVGPGDEVIVPSSTFIATWLAVSAVGARLVPVEPELATYNLDPLRVERAITRRTRVILAVHLYGRGCDVQALQQIADKHGLLLVVDAAQAHGMKTRGITSAFSFYPSKNLGALGDAGAVVTDDARLADQIRVLGNYGSRVKYYNEVKGVNSRMDPLQAAILRAKLQKLGQWNVRRQQIAAQYLDQLEGIPDLTLPLRAKQDESVWYAFPIRYPDRDWLAGQLESAGVGTLIHYPLPPHLSEAYADLGFSRGNFPIAEEIARTVLSLPLHPHLTQDQVEEVIGSVCLAACLPAGEHR
jgi:dTDP-4-amino-4,6-dideoxygalactose transaminase